MSVNYYNKIGSMVVTKRWIDENHHRTHKDYKVDIWRGNCLAVFIYEYEENGETWEQLYTFWNDDKQLNRMFKTDGKIFWDKVSKVELNMSFPECAHLLNVFLKYGYDVKCYKDESKLPK